VLIVNASPQASGNWLRVTRAQDSSSFSGIEGDFSRSRGLGTYSFLGVVFIPSGSQTVTFEFDQVLGNGVPFVGRFWHLDFTQDNKIRIDDAVQTNLTFPRDKIFTLSVKLDIFQPCAVAHITLLGFPGSGSWDYVLPHPAADFAQRVGAIGLSMGVPSDGTPPGGAFDTNDLLVTYQAPTGGATAGGELPQECRSQILHP
jgi:hypothetical protein